MELKKKYAQLTPEQQTIYDNPSSIVDMETKEAAIEAAVPTLDEEIMKEMPKSETEAIADSIMMNTEKEIAAAVTEHKEEEKTSVAETEKKVKEFDTVDMQNELANSMRQILSGMRGVKPVAELKQEPKPEPKQEPEAVAVTEEEPEEQIEGQMSIDDILTEKAESTAEPTKVQPMEEQNILEAKTINLSESIRKEIGDRDLRSYAAELAARQKEAVKMQIPVPDLGKTPELKEIPAEKPVHKTI